MSIKRKSKITNSRKIFKMAKWQEKWKNGKIINRKQAECKMQYNRDKLIELCSEDNLYSRVTIWKYDPFKGHSASFIDTNADVNSGLQT